MVTTFLQGGLGNFLFQISAAVSLANKNNDITVFSEDNIYVVHNQINTYKNNILRNISFTNGMIPTTNVYNEPRFQYNEIPYKKDLKLIGYFQSEKYFTNRDKMLELFGPTPEIKEYINNKYGSFIDGSTCSIHVRRGDYLKHPTHHPTCSLEYYKKAMNVMPIGTRYLVFSDDIDWCKENFKGHHMTFIENEKDYIDLYIMSMCKHNITANSSFSWWGAWLNPNRRKIVISPLNWFGPDKIGFTTEDLIPKTWNQI